MKKKLLHIITLVFFSVGCVHCMFNTLLTADIVKLFPLKISPQIQIEEYTPGQKNKYSPKELNRIYMFENIRRSVERGKKGITS